MNNLSHSSASSSPLSVRSSLRRACENAGVWAFGNGLVGSSLIYYWAMEYGAKGLALGLIIAAPRFLGLLRLSTPWLLERIDNTKRFCISAYASSTLFLFLLPWLTKRGTLSTNAQSLGAMTILWATYHLFEFLGTIALWAWLGDLVPHRIRGSFIGYRDRWLVLGRMLGMLTGGLFNYAWNLEPATRDRVTGYSLSLFAGATMMLLAVIPLLGVQYGRNTNSKRMALNESKNRETPRRKKWLTLLASKPYRRLLAYGCWLSASNGLSQSAQYLFTKSVLKIEYFELLGMRAMLRVGQSAIGPRIGKALDHNDPRRVMVVSQLLVAAGLLCYFLARPGATLWVAAAFILWIAYAGLNVSLPKLMLDTAPDENYAPAASLFFAATELCNGLSILLGGWLFDRMRTTVWNLGDWQLDRYGIFFLTCWGLRSLGVILILRIQPLEAKKK